MSIAPPQPINALHIRPFSGVIKGRVRVGGDKSISHRAIILAGLAAGKSVIHGLSSGEDVAATLRIMQQCGITSEQHDNITSVYGLGLGGLQSPDNILNCGNSGTTARLMLGILASHKLSACLTGDASLRRRPMRHVMLPLIQMGAQFVGQSSDDTRAGLGSKELGTLPLTLHANPLMNLVPIDFTMTTPSAQLKSAIILAALNIAGETSIIETRPSRDHTERMLAGFGGKLDIDSNKQGEGVRIKITGHQELTPCEMAVPGDPSSAAFLAALAVLNKGADLVIEHVGVNPHRIGFYQALQRMGADIRFENLDETKIIPKTINEPIANIHVKGGQTLSAIDIPASEAVGMIDEYPILSVVAAYARGMTNMRGLSQLRVKESDRLTAIAENLNANGVEAGIRGNDLSIRGCAGPPPGGGWVKTMNDHRIAMAFLIFGAGTQKAVTIDNARQIQTSFPDFTEKITALGLTLEAGQSR